MILLDNAHSIGLRPEPMRGVTHIHISETNHSLTRGLFQKLKGSLRGRSSLWRVGILPVIKFPELMGLWASSTGLIDQAEK